MDDLEITVGQKDFDFPLEVKPLTMEECAKILRKALSISEKFKTQLEVSKATGINIKTVGDYFTARHKPPQEKWNLLREALFKKSEKDLLEKKTKKPKRIEVKQSIERLKAILFLLKDELEYFKDSTLEDRELLKENIPGPSIGYIASLLTSLYDENQLEIFKNFSK
ncbi:MAG: hypothetical protein JW723_07060 [Bacteroidales bacterium]|nr:hypothetical protein [Bacteroidales bacterium]